MKDRANAGFYDTDAATYDSTRFVSANGRADHLHLMSMVHAELGHMDLTDVAEVGVGTGRVTRVLQSAGAIRIRCFDTSAEMLHHAETNADEPAPEYFLADAYSLPLKDDEVTSLVAVNLLSHLEDLETFWSEASRVVAPGGQILITTTRLDSLFFPFGLAVNIRRRAIGQAVYSRWHMHRSHVNAAERAGLTLLDGDGEIYLPRSLDKWTVTSNLVQSSLRAFRCLPRRARHTLGPMSLLRGTVV